MRIYGTFKTINDDTITVTIENNNVNHADINIDTSDSIRFADDPIEIDVDCEDSFTHIITTSAKISFLTKTWLGDYLFGDNYTSIPVEIKKGDSILFAGYVTPNTFSQDYAEMWEILEINCVDGLSIMENRHVTDSTDYETLKMNVNTRTFSNILLGTGIVSTNQNYVLTQQHTPKLYFDCSKKYSTYDNIFNGLMISSGLFLGDSEDDVWTYWEIIEEMMRYLNLHIVQIGYDFYMFDWENIRNNTSITWLDIVNNTTTTKTFNIIALTKDKYGSNDTQLSMADVFNQIQVKDDITELETVITSPFDDDTLLPLDVKQKYLVEYGSNGKDIDSLVSMMVMAFTNDTPQNDYSYKKEWYTQIFNCTDWTFKLNDVDNYSAYNNDQSNFLKYIFDTPFSSAIVGFGSGNKRTNKNTSTIQNIQIDNKYIVINIAGTGVDEKSYDDDWFPDEWAHEQHPIYPNETDLQNLNMSIEYKYNVDGVYSPASPNVTNYIVFNGKILMTTNQETLGDNGTNISGFNPHVAVFDIYQDRFNLRTLDANDNKNTYVDFQVSLRKNYTFDSVRQQYEPIDDDNVIDKYFNMRNLFGRLTPYDGALSGHYYLQQYYNKQGAQETTVRLSPPIVQGELAKRFKYSIGKTSYYKTDVIKYVDVLACELKIGDKFCTEAHDANGNKTFTWMTQAEIDAINVQHPDLDDVDHVFPYIYLAIDIDDGQFLIGDEHPIYNNVYSDMGLKETTGMAIPMKSSDNLSGNLSFRIIGPVNISWDNGIRRHPTWFSSERLTPNVVSVLPHVGQIWIKDFKVDLASDNGKQVVGTNDDIIYVSDEQTRFVNKKDDIDFRFTTALSEIEASELGVGVTINKSDVIGADTGVPITQLLNRVTNETNKPEKFYVDSYYREYNTPRLIMNSTIHGGDELDKYSINYLGKNFLVQGYEYYVHADKKKLKMKEF